jgi:hypothetical protein
VREHNKIAGRRQAGRWGYGLFAGLQQLILALRLRTAELRVATLGSHPSSGSTGRIPAAAAGLLQLQPPKLRGAKPQLSSVLAPLDAFDVDPLLHHLPQGRHLPQLQSRQKASNMGRRAGTGGRAAESGGILKGCTGRCSAGVCRGSG